MKIVSTKTIGYIIASGFILVTIAGYLILDQMNHSEFVHQEKIFHTDAKLKINIFKNNLNNLSQKFKTYAQLPAFKSIRFHSLTLNKLGVAENMRQLELFFFEIIKHNRYLQEIKFIDDHGNERLRVDKSTIHHKLINLKEFPNASHILEQNIQPENHHVDILRDKNGTISSMFWWLPIYVSSTKRLGYLSFHIDRKLLADALLDISDSTLTYAAITDESDNLLLGEYQLISSQLPHNYRQQDATWFVTAPIPLNGLEWNITIIGNQNTYTKGNRAIQNAIDFGLIPSALMILILLFYMFREKVESEKEMHNLAYYDSLTGLVNRHQFDMALANALDEAREHNLQHAMLYLDLDQFKVVNDTCGHMAGDKLLEDLSIHLKKVVRDSDILARIGGDEFALLLNHCPDEVAVSIANKILASVADFRFFWENQSFTIGVSIGVVLINNPDETASNILRKADLACYMAKELGRNRIHIFTDEDQSLEERHGEMQWVSRINNAIEENLFFLVAQPIVALNDTASSAQRHEILIRLREGSNEFPPGAFIPAAERYGIMPNIDRWVITHTFQFIERLNNSSSSNKDNSIFSINVSGLSLGEKSFFPFIKEQLLHYKISPKSICFEITETATIANLSVAMDFIKSVKNLGCSLALDDFGSGLCSFNYLKTIPVDYLKIDGSFITRMLDNPLDMSIVVAIEQISHATGSKVIAEYVESIEIMEKLKELNIDYAQGYAISMPIKVENLLP